MVTFVCNECGASCRKNAVEKHGFKCRFNSLSCIDCNKDFTRKTYQEHNQCITENQKYGGKDYVEKPNCDKGKKKQDQWLTNIENYVASGAAGNMSHHLNAILGYPNVPRKWKKFDNFARNCLRIMHPDQVQQLWNAIEAANKVGETSNKSHETNVKNSGQNGVQVDQSEATDANLSLEVDLSKAKDATLSLGLNGTKGEDSGKSDVVDQKKGKEKKKDKKRKKEPETQDEVIPSANEVCEFNEETLKKPKLDVNEEMTEKKEKKRRKEKDEEEKKRRKEEDEEEKKRRKEEDEEEEEKSDETNQNVSTENTRIEMDLNIEKEKKFQFKKEMLKLIKEDENQEVSLEVMKNKIYKLVKKFEGKKNSREEIYKKVDKIITGSKRFVLDNQIVKLKHTLL